MKNILKWFSESKEAEPVDKPVSPEQVLKALSGFRLAESEVHNLSTVITTQSALDRMLSALKGQRWSELQQKIDLLATTWSGSRALVTNSKQGKLLLLACQSLVGMDCLHPAFEAAIGSLNECGGFGSVIDSLLYAPVGSDGTYYVSVQDKGIKVSVNSYGRNSVNYEIFAPWTVVSSVGERDFWLRFVRKMTSITLQDQTPKAANVKFLGDLGTLTTFASQLASVVEAA